MWSTVLKRQAVCVPSRVHRGEAQRREAERREAERREAEQREAERRDAAARQQRQAADKAAAEKRAADKAAAERAAAEKVAAEKRAADKATAEKAAVERAAAERAAADKAAAEELRRRATALGLLQVLTTANIADDATLKKAIAFCDEQGVTSVSDLVEYDLADDFVFHLGLKYVHGRKLCAMLQTLSCSC